MSDVAPASWIAVFMAISGALFVVFMSRRGR
jgi:nicotinamide riboside transporter PnuC